jgi:hypothetical protein
MFKVEIETGKVDAAEFERIKRFFMRLELIAHCKEDFDVNDHFNEKDHDYEYMMQFQKEGIFNYKQFLANSINGIGTGFARIINGYEELVDKYCDPESLVLEPYKSENDKKIEEYFTTIEDNKSYSYKEFHQKCPVKISSIRFFIKLEYWASLRPGVFEYPANLNEIEGHFTFRISVSNAPIGFCKSATSN